MDTIVKAKYILSEKGKILQDNEIHIKDNTIVYIGPPNSTNAEFVYNYLDKGLVLPAFINAHTHIPETLIRGLCDDEEKTEKQILGA